MASLKDIKVVVEEGGGSVWGQLPNIPYKSDKFCLGFTLEAQRVVCHARDNSGRPPSASTIIEFTKIKSTLWKTLIAIVT